ncbi:CoA transferase, partial [Azohydromonas lata]|uniref:CoA transferase n=1 Tax=Azohydromonas lata TaxID=45677 RepID=UPI000B001BD8
FTVKDGEQIFLAAVSDTQWALMCREFGMERLAADPRLKTNNDRVRAREWLLPALRDQFAAYGAAELAARFEKIGLPYAPITRPQDLFNDPHLLGTGGLAPVSVPADASGAGQAVDTHTPLLPLALGGQRLPLRTPPPALGAHTQALLRELGCDDTQIQALRADGVIGAQPDATPASAEPAKA